LNPPGKDRGESKTAPFERFLELARRLVSVPKKEIDRRAEAYEKQKKRGA